MKLANLFIRLMTFVLAATIATAARPQATTSDRDIKIRKFEPLKYPIIAAGAHTAGAVVVRVALDAEGKVSGAAAVSGDPLLVDDAIENARKWQFEPNAERAAVIVYLFKIEGTCNENQYATNFSFISPNIGTVTTCSLTPVP